MTEPPDPFEAEDALSTLGADEMPTLDAEPKDLRPELAAKIPQTIGQYRVLSKLGEGGMGVIYEAEQKNPKRNVAVKVVRGGQIIDEASVRMFQREADTLARLKHPNIAAIYESGRTQDGQHFFAMELVQGETLDAYLEKRPQEVTPQELRARLELFRQIADAVHYAHQRGVIHRDLKPSNVIVTEQTAEEGSTDPTARLPEVKILDFGLARITEGDMAAMTMLTEVGVIKGTLPYMSPEQARGNPEEIDVRADVYALGVMLYEMLTGERPYKVDKMSLIDAVRVICETPPRPLGDAWNGVRRLDPDLETIVGKALEKDADRRYGGAGALSEDVDRYLASQPILARPPSTTYLLKKLVARNRLATAFAGTVLVLLLGFGIWMSALWRQSEISRWQAVEAARRAEASKLLALGQLELDSDPTTALAYATKSLELADSPEARLFALRALSVGPPATILPGEVDLAGTTARATFSPGGEWMALEGGRDLGVVSRDGATRLLLGSFPNTAGLVSSRFTREGDALLATKGGELRFWSVPEFEEIDHRKIPVPEGASFELWGTQTGFFVYTLAPSGEGGSEQVITPLSLEGEPGSLKTLVDAGQFLHIDPAGRWLGFYAAGGSEVLLRALGDWQSPPRIAGVHAEAISSVRFHPDGQRIAAVDRSGEVRFWSTEPPGHEPLRTLTGARVSGLVFDAGGDRLALWGRERGAYLVQLWDLGAPVEALPSSLVSSGTSLDESPSFSPDGRWLTTNHREGRALWPVSQPQPMVLSGAAGPVTDLAFGSDGGHLVSTAHGASGGELREWNLGAGGRSRVLGSFERVARQLALDPRGRFALASVGNQVLIVPMAGGSLHTLADSTQFIWQVALDSEGRRAAATSVRGPPEAKLIRIWDLESEEMRTLGSPEEAREGKSGAHSAFEFLPGGRLVSVGTSGLQLWDIEAGTSEVLAPSAEDSQLTVFGGGRSAAYSQEEYTVAITDLETRVTRLLPSHGTDVWPVVVDPGGEVIVTGSVDGSIRVGLLTGEEPHLLLGHEGLIRTVAISPDGRWIASGGDDGTIRLWPMPDLSKPPLHTLEHEELLAKLHSLTNIRVVEDPDSTTGWKIDVAAFPGWEEVPAW